VLALLVLATFFHQDPANRCHNKVQQLVLVLLVLATFLDQVTAAMWIHFHMQHQ